MRGQLGTSVQRPKPGAALAARVARSKEGGGDEQRSRGLLIRDGLQIVAHKLHLAMKVIRQTEEFSEWLRKLSDVRARARIAARIDRLALGNPGDVGPVGEGVSEMRIHYGPGYRVYFIQRGAALVVLLCGGDKSTQPGDIRTAKQLASELED
jgi:putative addiction module killer protein